MLTHDGEIYPECRCKKDGANDKYADYLIRFHTKYLPVEAKVCVDREYNILGKAQMYCNVSSFNPKGRSSITPEEIYNDNCLLIDEYNILLYDDLFHDATEIMSLDDILNEGDVKELDRLIFELLR